MWTYLLGPFLALLPRRWRKTLVGDAWVDWVRASLLSGLLEGIGFLLALIGWYLYFLNRAVQQQLDVTIQATKGVPGEGAAYGMGAVALITFVLHPLTWALAYFAIEGVVRALAASLAEQPLGTLPLALLDGVIVKMRQREYEARVPLVADEVTRSTPGQSWALMVESCRPKLRWKYPLTVRYAEEFFQVMREAPGGVSIGADPARPHVYLLQRLPAGEGLRGLENYDPEAVLHAAEPGVAAQTVRAVRNKFLVRSLPLVADTVTRGPGGDAGDLRIESCRPKPDWTPGRTLRFEDRYYRIEGSYDAQSPRPFGFTLRLLAAGVPGRNVIFYSPEDVLRKRK